MSRFKDRFSRIPNQDSSQPPSYEDIEKQRKLELLKNPNYVRMMELAHEEELHEALEALAQLHHSKMFSSVRANFKPEPITIHESVHPKEFGKRPDLSRVSVGKNFSANWYGTDDDGNQTFWTERSSVSFNLTYVSEDRRHVYGHAGDSYSSWYKSGINFAISGNYGLKANSEVPQFQDINSFLDFVASIVKRG
jgi:hypothetical protein